MITVYSVWNQPYQALADIVMPNRQRYCEKHGYRLVTVPDWIGERHPFWSRFDGIVKVLESTDILLMLDLDAVISNQDIKVEDVISEADLTIASDINGINAGVMVWRNSAWSRTFLQKVWNEGPRFFHYPNSEQSTIAQLLYLEDKDRWHVHQQRVMNSYNYANYNLVYPQGEWQAGDYILHLPACNLETRIQRFKAF